jgi:para-nitrobenzyl esterase
MFDNLHQPGVEFFTGPNPPQAIADVMHRAWIAFARNGDPNHDGLPTWPAYNATARSTMHFDMACRVSRDDHSDVRTAWQDVSLFT